MTKLFGDNKQFSADVVIVAGEAPKTTTIPGKMYFDAGKTRFEVNLSDAKGDQITPATMQQMKSMGMDKTQVISRPDSKTTH